MSEDELARVESLVNQSIEKKLPVYAEVAPQEQALKINGLRAVFGEKYPPMVRVVCVGASVKDLLGDPTNAKWREYSIEFCGGTHLKNASEAQQFVVTSDESVSKGIRRIIAHTGPAASAASAKGAEVTKLIDRAKDAKEFAPLIAELNKHLAGETLPLRIKRRAQATVAELQDRQRKAEKAAAKASAGSSSLDVAAIASDLLTRAIQVPGGGKVVVSEVSGASDDQLRGVIDSLRKRETTLAALLGSTANDKVTFVSVVSDDLIAKGLKAGDWIREPAKTAGGGGGGKPQMAQAGGKDPSKLPEALEAARTFAKKTLGLV
jgi:alanyl-tRNA synthetase